MALNDEAERLNLAEEYLLTYSPQSQEFDAALDHVLWVHKNKPEYRQRCASLLTSVIKQRSGEEATIRKLRLISSG